MEFALRGLWQWVLWLIAALILAYLVRLELRRPNRRQLALRLLASAVALLSLALLCLEPMYRQPVRVSDAFLLTSGSDAKQVQHAADSLHPACIFALPHAPLTDTLDNLERLPNVAMLLRRYPHVRRVHIFGDGLRPDELESLSHLQLVLHLAPLPDGPVAVSYPHRIALGEPLRVQGTWHASRRDSLWLYLDVNGEHCDSLSLVGESQLPFELNAVPRQLGKWLYTFCALRTARDTAFAGTIPIQVVPPQPIHVLILESAPNFETRTLKQWASITGNALVIRSMVSREKFFTEFLNTTPFALERLTPSILEKVDVVIIDLQTLVRLSASEQAALRQAVEAGLGLLIALPDAPAVRQLREHDFFLGFFTAVPESRQGRFVRPQGFSLRHSSSTALPIAPLRLRGNFGTEILMQDEAGQPLVLSSTRGLGKVAVSIVQETFRWALEGQRELYADYWSHALKCLARPNLDTDLWTHSLLPTVDLPCHFTLRTSPAMPIAVVELPSGVRDTLFFRQHPIEPTRWESTLWPREPGWHQVQRIGTADSTSVAFYVHSSQEEWSSLRRALMHQATQAFAHLHPHDSVHVSMMQTYEPISPWWFFVLFVMAAAYLWAERKF
jgi:hypothetical protein